MFRGLQSLIPKKNKLSSEEKTEKDLLNLDSQKSTALNKNSSNYSSRPYPNQPRQYIFNIEIEKIKANPYQPRTSNDHQSLQELSQSIQNYGIIQPIIVSKIIKSSPTGKIDEYELISGHRRLAAAKIAGLRLIPAIIREKEANNQEKLELALIENIQRENLNPIDLAKAFSRLHQEFGLTLTEIGKKVSRDKRTISQTIGLLKLRPEIQQFIIKKHITEGQVRPLITLDFPTQKKLFDKIINEGLTSRQSEDLVRETKKKLVKSYRRSPRNEKLEQICQKLSDQINLPVKAQKDRSGKGGKLIIKFDTIQGLEEIVQKIISSTLN